MYRVEDLEVQPGVGVESFEPDKQQEPWFVLVLFALPQALFRLADWCDR